MTEGQQQAEGQAPQDAQGGGQQLDGGARTFTQDELNAIVADRLTRERQKYADYEDLKGKASQLDELQAAQLSELEKAQKRAADLEAERDRALSEANDRLIRAAFVAEAAKAGAAHPEDAFALADIAGVTIGEDASVTGVAEAVAALVEGGRLVMSGRPAAPNLDGGAGGGNRPGDTKAKALSEAELIQARKLGLTPEQYQRGKEPH